MLAEGETLSDIAKALCVNRTTLLARLNSTPELIDKYARAREMQADLMAAQTVTIADEAQDANLARLRVDARKWYASKLQPKKYGDKIAQEVTGDLSFTVITGVPRADG